MLTHLAMKRIDLEHEPGEWIEVRMPSLEILERASQSRAKKAMSLMSGIDLEQLRGLMSPNAATARPDYDQISLMQSCILAWSYKEPVTPENVAELDGVTAQCLMEVLVPQEDETARKNGFGGSMSPSKETARPR